MKLRTVLSELGVSDYVAGADVRFDGEVIVFPAPELKESFSELLVLAPEGAREPQQGFVSTTLVYCGAGPLDHAERPSDRTLFREQRS